jgi:aminopeptidase N
VRYDLALTIPSDRTAPITGTVHIRFAYTRTRDPLVLDFVNPLQRVHRVLAGDRMIEYGTTAEHILIPPGDLRDGENEITAQFTAGNESLNRNPDFLYTLFVPDRARYAFPVFDQPDLKARVTLTLTVPEGWVAVANGIESTDRRTGGPTDTAGATRAMGTRTYYFAETPPIPTYLIAFAAGRFQIEEAERDGRHLRMFHRETDVARVQANRDAIFDLEAKALTWLEDYTGIPFPFPKFDFFAVPAFQYGGMEHPGAVFYRASSLFLEPTATQNEVLGRASLIAHETAHMWFGDLVTMRWFNDVWMKEVFANFMAAKIVNPSFPEINHDLRFMLAHHPAAYAIDRTAGTNPIRQPLANLNGAGSLYGAIIYQKAPIVMRQLEQRVGEDTFRDGLRHYLENFKFGNATWSDLIAELDSLTPDDLGAWSDIWVESTGRPTVTTELGLADDTVAALAFHQSDPEKLGRLWPQRLTPVVANGMDMHRFSVDLTGATVDVPGAKGLPRPLFVLANGDGLPYGDFVPDSMSLDGLVAHLADVHDDVVRAAGWLTVWDAMLDGRLPPTSLMTTARAMLESETSELTAQRVLSDLGETYWRYLADDTRDSLAPSLETFLWTRLQATPARSLKATYFGAYRSIARSPAAVGRLERLWREQDKIAGLPLAERDFTALALALAVREVPGWESILTHQRDRITNPDRRARFEFVMPAVSADTAVRDAFFATLRDPQNREHEPWVLDALGYLHHPLRAKRAERYILPSLELLQEIQRTGDIFFPLGWLNGTLDGHNTPSAAALVRRFLDARPDYPAQLRGKLLQAADGLERSARIVFGSTG